MADIAEETLTNRNVFISHEVLAEVVYVLKGVYSVSRNDISNLLTQLISFENIHTVDDKVTIFALRLFQEKNLDFVDCLLCSYSENNEVRTFDKKLLKCIESR